MGNKYSGIFTQGYGIGAPPQANMMQQYRTPAGVTPPMALPVPMAPTSNAPTTTPYVLPMLQRVAQAAAQRRQAEERAVTAPAAAAAGIGAGTEAAGMPTSISEAFGSGLMSPTGRAITGASLAGLAAGGWSPTPVSLGQGIASMGAAAQKGYLEGKKAELEEAARKAAADKAAFDRRLAIAQYRQKNREIEATSGKTQRAITKEQFDMEDKLFNKYESVSSENREAFFGYQKVRNAAQAYKDAAARGEEPSGASDIALLIGYMKTLDPGSVVRETEYATAKNAGGVSERVRNIFNNVRDGVILTPKLREDFIKSATTQVQPYIERQIKLDKKYTKRAKDYDLNPERVITPFLPNIFGSVDEAEKASLPVGSLVIINDRLAVIE